MRKIFNYQNNLINKFKKIKIHKIKKIKYKMKMNNIYYKKK